MSSPTGDEVLRSAHLQETNVRALLTKALTADVEAILANQTRGMCADAAI